MPKNQHTAKVKTGCWCRSLKAKAIIATTTTTDSSVLTGLNKLLEIR
jgi:hypothetical protein